MTKCAEPETDYFFCPAGASAGFEAAAGASAGVAAGPASAAFGPFRPADHAIEIGADAVWLALSERVAGLTLLGRIRALVHGRAGEQLFDRLIRLFRRLGAGRRFGRRNLETGLYGLDRVKH